MPTAISRALVAPVSHLHPKLVDDALEPYGCPTCRSPTPGGTQQRVAIARAVAYQTEVLLMDEPFAAVVAQTRADLEDLIRTGWRKLGVTVLFVTHDIDESAYPGERVIILSSSPTVTQEDLAIDLPDERDQLNTRSLLRFTELRHHVSPALTATDTPADASLPA